MGRFCVGVEDGWCVVGRWVCLVGWGRGFGVVGLWWVLFSVWDFCGGYFGFWGLGWYVVVVFVLCWLVVLGWWGVRKESCLCVCWDW